MPRLLPMADTDVGLPCRVVDIDGDIHRRFASIHMTQLEAVFAGQLARGGTERSSFCRTARF